MGCVERDSGSEIVNGEQEFKLMCIQETKKTPTYNVYINISIHSYTYLCTVNVTT